MIKIPRIRKETDFVDALCMLHEDAAEFELLDRDGLNALMKVIRLAENHTKEVK